MAYYKIFTLTLKNGNSTKINFNITGKYSNSVNTNITINIENYVVNNLSYLGNKQYGDNLFLYKTSSNTFILFLSKVINDNIVVDKLSYDTSICTVTFNMQDSETPTTYTNINKCIIAHSHDDFYTKSAIDLSINTINTTISSTKTTLQNNINTVQTNLTNNVTTLQNNINSVNTTVSNVQTQVSNVTKESIGIYSGTGDPDNSLGKDGEIYIKY